MIISQPAVCAKQSEQPVEQWRGQCVHSLCICSPFFDFNSAQSSETVGSGNCALLGCLRQVQQVTDDLTCSSCSQFDLSICGRFKCSVVKSVPLWACHVALNNRSCVIKDPQPLPALSLQMVNIHPSNAHNLDEDFCTLWALFAHFNASQWPPNLTLQCGCVHAGCLLLKHFPF